MADVNFPGIKPTDDYPHPSLPVIYADGIATITPGAYTVKTYLYRTDPHVMAKPEAQNQLVAQIVMPTPTFVFTALFMERSLKQFIAQGTIDPKMVAMVRETFETLDKMG